MASAAVVARTSTKGTEYLVRNTRQAEWVVNAEAAIHFENLHEATRAALRLPGALKAFALPATS
jgi:hypothetical protein